ncbi:unnamed protein product [Paramecium sonneborni]|uniref:Uncharacterized protein n=1 Tax=Paramecium sonneborni TaxID=65129 RepID=A0A8S1RPS5_9CILI|nr:unnamed protein product [Paramecium sonneborni]
MSVFNFIIKFKLSELLLKKIIQQQTWEHNIFCFCKIYDQKEKYKMFEKMNQHLKDWINFVQGANIK